MTIAHDHNLHRPAPPPVRPYGIRVSLPPGDPFRRLLGEDWQREHWYATAGERDAALHEMSRRHEYSRIGDRPALTFERIQKLAEGRAR
ncbi:MAG: hypothetical protein O9284_10830 [Steroidobacteraceae bacterium]|jgi:hypothetical protein|nr:hypothetical protein [Steroidobacteraceae bacterium]